MACPLRSVPAAYRPYLRSKGEHTDAQARLLWVTGFVVLGSEGTSTIKRLHIAQFMQQSTVLLAPTSCPARRAQGALPKRSMNYEVQGSSGAIPTSLSQVPAFNQHVTVVCDCTCHDQRQADESRRTVPVVALHVSLTARSCNNAVTLPDRLVRALRLSCAPVRVRGRSPAACRRTADPWVSCGL